MALAIGVDGPTQPGLLTPQQIRKQKEHWTKGKAVSPDHPAMCSFGGDDFGESLP